MAKRAAKHICDLGGMNRELTNEWCRRANQYAHSRNRIGNHSRHPYSGYTDEECLNCYRTIDHPVHEENHRD